MIGTWLPTSPAQARARAQAEAEYKAQVKAEAEYKAMLPYLIEAPSASSSNGSAPWSGTPLSTGWPLRSEAAAAAARQKRADIPVAGVESEVTGDHGRGYRDSVRRSQGSQDNKLTKQLPKGGEDDLERVHVTRPVEVVGRRDLYVMRLNLTVNDRGADDQIELNPQQAFPKPAPRQNPRRPGRGPEGRSRARPVMNRPDPTDEPIDRTPPPSHDEG